jgi:hypothetical protein
MKVGVPITILGQMKHHHNTEKLMVGGAKLVRTNSASPVCYANNVICNILV